MNAFVNAIKNEPARTANGMRARKSTSDACVDLFFKIGASRGKDILPEFAAAYAEDPEIAVRIALWARDVRGGAGERQLFRDIAGWLQKRDESVTLRVLGKVPEVGRWDDLLVFQTPATRAVAVQMIRKAINTTKLCDKIKKDINTMTEAEAQLLLDTLKSEISA